MSMVLEINKLYITYSYTKECSTIAYSYSIFSCFSASFLLQVLHRMSNFFKSQKFAPCLLQLLLGDMIILWYRTKFENEMIAADDALMLHWKRSCWVVNMWKQADKQEMQLQPVTSYGWCLKEGELKVEWDTESNIGTIRARVHALTKGCKCTTGCATNRCSCRRRGNKCSLGCECINCANIQQSNTYNPYREAELRDLAIEEEHSTDEMITNLFGRSPGSQQSRRSDTESVSDTDSDTKEPIVNRGIQSEI